MSERGILHKNPRLVGKGDFGSSNPGDLVADFFSGSGQHLQLRRAWDVTFSHLIKCGRSIYTTRTRLSIYRRIQFERDSAFEDSVCELIKKSRLALMVIRITLLTSLDLDYWEVGPELGWGNSSRARCRLNVRAKRRNSMKLKVKDRRKACLRVVTVQVSNSN